MKRTPSHSINAALLLVLLHADIFMVSALILVGHKHPAAVSGRNRRVGVQKG